MLCSGNEIIMAGHRVHESYVEENRDKRFLMLIKLFSFLFL